MTTQLFTPGPALSPYIDNIMTVDIDWRRITDTPGTWRLLPFGQVSMLFLYGDSHGYSMNGPDGDMQTTAGAFLVGQLTQPIWLRFSGHTRLIKVQFKTTGIQQFLPLNMETFTNVPSIELETIWGSAVSSLLDQLHGAPSDASRVALLQRFLRARMLPPRAEAGYIDYTMQHLQADDGSVNIPHLEKKLGITGRHLERLFRARVGLSPTEMNRIIRLNYAFQRLEKNPGISLTTLSHELGYYDQAHFTRNFKKLAGVSPSKLLAHHSGELFVSHGKCFVNQAPIPTI